MAKYKKRKYKKRYEFGKKKGRGVPIGYKHHWKYPNGKWNETKVGKGGKWKFRFKSSKIRKGSKKGGPPKGYKILWKINGLQRATKVGPRKYETDMIGQKQALGWYDPKKKRWIRNKGVYKRGTKGYGIKDGSQRGRKSGGRGRNKTSICRHPKKRRLRVY